MAGERHWRLRLVPEQLVRGLDFHGKNRPVSKILQGEGGEGGGGGVRRGAILERQRQKPARARRLRGFGRRSSPPCTIVVRTNKNQYQNAKKCIAVN
jgi:hypothetical protein